MRHAMIMAATLVMGGAAWGMPPGRPWKVVEQDLSLLRTVKRGGFVENAGSYQLDGVTFYFGEMRPGHPLRLIRPVSAEGASDKPDCAESLAVALKSLAAQARTSGANAVIELRSSTDADNAPITADHFLCRHLVSRPVKPSSTYVELTGQLAVVAD